MTVDFYLDETGFDKLTDFPRRYGGALAYARAHPGYLARWLYEHQSGQRRSHAANRLFVVLHDALDPGRTWELRRDFDWLEKTIRAFLDRPRLVRVDVTDGDGTRYRPLAGVIFCVRD